MPVASAKIIACAMVLLAPAIAGAEPAVLSLARAYLGPESTLEGITSIHYVGTLERRDPDHAERAPIVDALDMTFAKPLRQRLVVSEAKATRTTVLDGYDAWDRTQDNSDPTKFRLTWLGAGDIKTLRANTWENLYYYQSPEGGSIVDMGPATIDGIACERVDFTHGPGTVYERYFDRDTGRLVLTVTGPEMIRESGEIRADGIRFAKTVVSTTKTASGREQVTTVTFDSVTLNQPVPADFFTVPSIAPREASLPAVVPAGK